MDAMIRMLRRLFGFPGAERVSHAPHSDPVPAVAEPAHPSPAPAVSAPIPPEAKPPGPAAPRALKPARPRMKHDVFLSYFHTDWEQAKLLERDLTACGLKVWRDERHHPAPQPSAVDAINEAFLLSSRVLVLWSVDSMLSHWVKEEAEAARHAHKIVALALSPLDALRIPAEFEAVPIVALSEIRRDPALLLRDLGAVETAGQPGSFTLVQPDLHIDALPPALATPLFGRERELALLTKAWDQGAPRVLAFDALAGAGKSALVTQFVHTLQTCGWRGARAIFAWPFAAPGAAEDRQGNSSAFFQAAFAFFAKQPSPEWIALQEQATCLGLEAPCWPPRDEREKGAELARHVQARRALLILDGLEPLQYGAAEPTAGSSLKDPAVQALLESLVRHNPGLCLITSRLPLPEFRDLPGFQELRLTPLDSVSAMRLLRGLGVEPDFPSADYQAWLKTGGDEARPALGRIPEKMPEGTWHLPVYGDFTGQLAIEIQSRRIARDSKLPEDLVRGLEQLDRTHGQALPAPAAFKLLQTAIQFDGHAQSLALAAHYLRSFHHGSIDAIREVPLLTAYPGAERSPFSVLRAMEAALVRQALDPIHNRHPHPGESEAGRGLATLLFLSFFEGPAPARLLPVVFPEVLPPPAPIQDPAVDVTGLAPLYQRQEPGSGALEPAEVWQPRAIKLETERRSLFRALFSWTAGYSAKDMAAALKQLASLGLVYKLHRAEAWERTSIDCPPLVREYFAHRLRSLDPATSESAHARLADHLRSLAPARPASAEEIAPLFAAVRHACLANRHEQAWSELYWPCIAREGERFASAQLGLRGPDLSTLSCFFDAPFARISPRLDTAAQASVLALSGFALRALGRFADSASALRSGSARFEALEDWFNATSGLQSLSELLLALGQLDASSGIEGALEAAARARVLAEKTGDQSEQLAALTTEGAVLQARGRLLQAEQRFRDAERLQREIQPELPRLYSLAGYLYGELLLARGRVAEVADRAQYNAALHAGQGSVLGRALAQLQLAQAQALLDPDSAPNTAGFVSLLPFAHSDLHLPRGYLALAETRLANPSAHQSEIVAALTAAEGIARRAGLPLFLADGHLLASRSALALGQAELAWDHRNKAAALIAKHRYGRREADLAVLDAEMSPSAETLEVACARIGPEGWWQLLPRLETIASQIPGSEPLVAPLRQGMADYQAEREASQA